MTNYRELYIRALEAPWDSPEARILLPLYKRAVKDLRIRKVIEEVNAQKNIPNPHWDSF